MVQMEQIYIPRARMKVLLNSSDALSTLEKGSECRITPDTEENCITLKGRDALCEYVAGEIVRAFGRGFPAKTACKLKKDNYYLKIIDLRDWTRNKSRIRRIKSRLIGTNGKAKLYIEEVSSASISVYGDTVSIIGREDEVRDAETAARTIIGGGSHRLAYTRMEASHRRHQ